MTVATMNATTPAHTETTHESDDSSPDSQTRSHGPDSSVGEVSITVTDSVTAHDPQQNTSLVKAPSVVATSLKPMKSAPVKKDPPAAPKAPPAPPVSTTSDSSIYISLPLTGLPFMFAIGE